MRIRPGLVLIFAFFAASLAERSRADDPARTATFSIVAADPGAGLLGAAVASKYPAVGSVVPEIRAGVGAFCTQHYHVAEWRAKAIELLAVGRSPGAVLEELLAGDDRPEQRQLAIIDQAGRIAVHHPTQADKSSEYWGGVTGRYYACQGNTLAGREVVAAMAKAYEETEGTFADRIMAALVAGDGAGGDHRGRLAAGIRVCRKGTEGYWLELDVDRSDDAVRELALSYSKLEHAARGPVEESK